MSYKKILNHIRELSSEPVELIAVSKYANDAQIAAAIEEGCVEFGENKVQDLARKSAVFGANIKWHMLGNLQSNKINQLLRAKPHLWQSCTNFALASAVDARLQYPLECLIELNAANEASKHGAALGEAAELFYMINENCKMLRAVGIMCIGAHTSETAAIRASFCAARREFERCKGARICSMGMSSDYEIALECGSNMLRIGSAIFR